MVINFGGNTLTALLFSVVAFVLTILALTEVTATGLFWAHLVLCLLLMASAVLMLASFGALIQEKGWKKHD